MLGLRFKILVLVPATLLMTAASTAIGIVNGRQVSAVILTSIGTAVLLQLGYIVGCIFQVMGPVLAADPIKGGLSVREWAGYRVCQ